MQQRALSFLSWGKQKKRAMEQYLLQVPKKLAQEVRKYIATGDVGKVEMISGGAFVVLVLCFSCGRVLVRMTS